MPTPQKLENLKQGAENPSTDLNRAFSELCNLFPEEEYKALVPYFKYIQQISAIFPSDHGVTKEEEEAKRSLVIAICAAMTAGLTSNTTVLNQYLQSAFDLLAQASDLIKRGHFLPAKHTALYINEVTDIVLGKTEIPEAAKTKIEQCAAHHFHEGRLFDHRGLQAKFANLIASLIAFLTGKTNDTSSLKNAPRTAQKATFFQQTALQFFSPPPSRVCVYSTNFTV